MNVGKEENNVPYTRRTTDSGSRKNNAVTPGIPHPINEVFRIAIFLFEFHLLSSFTNLLIVFIPYLGLMAIIYFSFCIHNKRSCNGVGRSYLLTGLIFHNWFCIIFTFTETFYIDIYGLFLEFTIVRLHVVSWLLLPPELFLFLISASFLRVLTLFLYL